VHTSNRVNFALISSDILTWTKTLRGKQLDSELSTIHLTNNIPVGTDAFFELADCIVFLLGVLLISCFCLWIQSRFALSIKNHGSPFYLWTWVCGLFAVKFILIRVSVDDRVSYFQSFNEIASIHELTVWSLMPNSSRISYPMIISYLLDDSSKWKAQEGWILQEKIHENFPVLFLVDWPPILLPVAVLLCQKLWWMGLRYMPQVWCYYWPQYSYIGTH
jgi:hypothetical protein